MTPAIEDILNDVKTYATCEDWQKRPVLMRIEIACEALMGQVVPPDIGPWTVSPDGSTIDSDNFDHDVLLRVSGDFYGDEARVAYANDIARRLNQM
jgi:hypothetical protein